MIAEYKIDVENSAFQLVCSALLCSAPFVYIFCTSLFARTLFLSVHYFAPFHSVALFFGIFFFCLYSLSTLNPAVWHHNVKLNAYISMLSFPLKCLFCYACGPNRVIQHVFQLFSDTNAFFSSTWAAITKNATQTLGNTQNKNIMNSIFTSPFHLNWCFFFSSQPQTPEIIHLFLFKILLNRILCPFWTLFWLFNLVKLDLHE